MAQVLGPKLETIEENIEQTKLDQKTALSTMITFTESMTRSFEDMKNTKATEVPVSLCKTEAVQTIVREQVKEALEDEIRRSEHREHSYIAHRDTLRQLLNDQSIFINRIQYENSERLIDYTDSTDVIKSAHFRKDGSIRITDSPEIVTLHDARTMKKVRWKMIR